MSKKKKVWALVCCYHCQEVLSVWSTKAGAVKEKKVYKSNGEQSPEIVEWDLDSSEGHEDE